jgi:hypothetical protein
MTSIRTIIEHSRAALAELTPETLTNDQLHRSLDRLTSFRVNEAIDDYWDQLPEKPDHENEIPAWEKDMHQRAKVLNHELKLFNDELNRIKTMQAALKVPQLEPLIRAAQEVIRPLYNFSAQLSQ